MLRNVHEAPTRSAGVSFEGTGTLDRRQKISSRDEIEDDSYLGWFMYTFRKFIDKKICRGDVVQSWMNRKSPAYDRDFENAVEREYGFWFLQMGVGSGAKAKPSVFRMHLLT